MEENKNAGTKKFKRKLTPFLCKEMLFDYATGMLDADRTEAVEEFLKKDEECQKLLENIRKGIEYAQSLSKTNLRPEIQAELMQAESVISLGRKYSSWKEWPETLRWSVTAIALSVVVAFSVAVVPWQRLAMLRGKKATPDTVEIAQIAKIDKQQQVDAIQANQEGDPGAVDEGSGDDIADEGPAPTPPEKPGTQVAGAQAGAAKNAKPPPDDEGSEEGGAHSHAPPPMMARGPDPDERAAEQAASRRDGKLPKGFLYRAFMQLNELEAVGPKIADHIRDFGGEKAGEVELGWKRGTGRYYHFALPEANEEKLLEKLRAYGPVRISKDPHPRIMPQGQVRFILWIESAD